MIVLLSENERRLNFSSSCNTYLRTNYFRKDIVKIKEFFEAEFPVIGHRIESMQVSSDGRHSREELLSAVKVDFSGTEVWVGSGFSLEERRRYAQRPELLEKAQVTVRYFQESSNKNNSKKSLRFPTIKAIFEEGPRMI